MEVVGVYLVVAHDMALFAYFQLAYQFAQTYGYRRLPAEAAFGKVTLVCQTTYGLGVCLGVNVHLE